MIPALQGSGRNRGGQDATDIETLSAQRQLVGVGAARPHTRARRRRTLSPCGRWRPDQLPPACRLSRIVSKPLHRWNHNGDLKGAVGVGVLGINGNVFHVQHHWVTESGDTIFLKDAFLTSFPTSDPNRVLTDSLNGADTPGGEGAFEGGTGTVFAFGAADLKAGQIPLRYAGTVCFKPE